jgi:hypothetical protein
MIRFDHRKKFRIENIAWFSRILEGVAELVVSISAGVKKEVLVVAVR